MLQLFYHLHVSTEAVTVQDALKQLKRKRIVQRGAVSGQKGEEEGEEQHEVTKVKIQHPCTNASDVFISVEINEIPCFPTPQLYPRDRGYQGKHSCWRMTWTMMARTRRKREGVIWCLAMTCGLIN